MTKKSNAVSPETVRLIERIISRRNAGMTGALKYALYHIENRIDALEAQFVVMSCKSRYPSKRLGRAFPSKSQEKRWSNSGSTMTMASRTPNGASRLSKN